MLLTGPGPEIFLSCVADRSGPEIFKSCVTDRGTLGVLLSSDIPEASTSCDAARLVPEVPVSSIARQICVLYAAGLSLQSLPARSPVLL